MKPRLQLVLDLRRGVEDAAKHALGVLEQERAGIVAERAALERSLLAASASQVAIRLREQLASFAITTRATATDCDRRTTDCEKRIDNARLVLAAAHREVRAIEAIQARDRATASRLALRREGRANDEFAARQRLEKSA